MSTKNDKKTRRIATAFAVKTVNEFVAQNAPAIMGRCIETLKSLPLEERQKIADAILKGNEDVTKGA